MSNMTDDSIMPFGKHKGEKLVNLPASYLVWLYENGKCNSDLRDYIIDNMDTLQQEIKQGL